MLLPVDGISDESEKLKTLVGVKVRKKFYGENDNSNNHGVEMGSPKWKVVSLCTRKQNISPKSL